MALHTLRRMASGGMYDQVGGGFSRYSVDDRWIVPHFEKMLYDNALLARAYLHAWQVSGEPLFLRVATETLDWALRELRQEEGGFASALDADSEGVEGKFYVWTPDEVRDALPEDLAPAALAALRDPARAATSRARASRCARRPIPERLDEIKAGLLAAREQRVRPGLDDKRLTAWNALMISALAEAGAVLERDDYLDAAVAAAEFLARDGCATRTAAGCAPTTAAGPRSPPTSRTTRSCSRRRSRSTRRRSTTAGSRRRASSPTRSSSASPTRERGGFFAVGADHELIARRKELEDAPIPSGGSAATYGLLRLAALTGEARYEQAAAGTIALLHAIAPQHPTAFGHLLQAIDFHLAPVKEVALAGPDTGALERAVRAEFRPHLVLAGGGGDVPLLEGRGAVDGRAAAYVCERFACQRPVTDPDELRVLLRREPTPHDPLRPHREVGGGRRLPARLDPGRGAVGQVRGRAEERVVVVPARARPSRSRR